MSKPRTMAPQEARALLGLAGPASPDAVTAAFRRTVKAARPDAPGGCPERFRQVIEAYRVIRRLEGPAAALPAPKAGAAVSPLPLPLTLDEALRGASRTVRLCGGRVLAVRLPAGLRAGERVRLRGADAGGGDFYLIVAIAAETTRRIDGDHLHVEAEVEPEMLDRGGRIEIDTGRGRRSVWIPRGFSGDALRLRGEGLPARGDHAGGDLFVRLRPRPAKPPRASELALRDFARAWSGGRAAAAAGL